MLARTPGAGACESEGGVVPLKPWRKGPAFETVDWPSTPLGRPDDWTPTLRQAVDVVVNTRFPATLLWGPEFVLVYNEAYVPILGDKHPWALGRPCAEVFPEAWHLIGDMMQAVLDGAPSSLLDDALVPLVRGGQLRDGYFTYSYSPVHNEVGEVEGVLDIVTETTDKVVALRRMAVLTELRARLADVEAVDELESVVLDVLSGATEDVHVVEYREAATRPGPAGRALPSRPPRSLRGADLLLDDTGAGHVAWIPVRSPGVDLADPPALVIALNPGLSPDHRYLDFLRLVATAVSQVRARLEAREVERRIALSERRLSEALQSSLLTTPRHPDDVQVAVRYRPSADQAEVGGDWYDAFVDPHGELTVTVGDVSGHDRVAAAGMAHARTMLRALAHGVDAGPSTVMGLLDRALEGLDLGIQATAVLMRLHRSESDAGRWLARWTNAGSLPPIVLRGDGTVEVLESYDLMLGVDPAVTRSDHEIELADGDVLVLYTDGLVERRGTSLTECIERLVKVVQWCAGLDVERAADRILLDVADEGVADDVALLVLRPGSPQG
jgi:serine phosphatase RsbU (regulator of sigma subunit)